MVEGSICEREEEDMGREACCSKEARFNRGPWSAKEDLLLTTYIQAHGEGQWRSLPNRAGLLRCGKSCRLRWLNYLRPGIKRGNITSEEEDLIIRLQSLLGNRWSLIAGRLPGRTDNEIKNHWNTRILKRLKQQGIHPKSNYHIYKKRKSKIIKNDHAEENQVLYLPKPRRVSAARFMRSSDDSCQLGSVGSSSQQQEQEQPRPRAAEVDDVSGDNNDNNISWDSFDYDLSLQEYTMLNEVYYDFLQLL